MLTSLFSLLTFTSRWWKGKVKDDGGEEGAVGLIPASYVEEVRPPLAHSTCRADRADSTHAPNPIDLRLRIHLS